TRSAMSRSRVVLPQPDGPIRLMNSPSPMVRLAPDRATVSLPRPLNTMFRSRTSMTGWVAGCMSLVTGASGNGPQQQLPVVLGTGEAAVLHLDFAPHRDQLGAPVDFHALEAA